MKERVLTLEQLAAYDGYLRREERAPGTREKYLRDLRAFALWLDGRPLEKELAHAWKEDLQAHGYTPVTINGKLSALNGLLCFLGWEDCQVKFLKIQRRLFREERRELTREEYDRLLETARSLGRGAASPADGNDLRHRYPGERGPLYHRGGRPARQGGSRPERENPHHPPAQQTLPEAAEIRQKTENRLRRDFSHGKRKRSFTAADLGGNETAVQTRQSGAVQGIPP